MPVSVGNDLGRLGEVRFRTASDQIAVRRSSVQHPHVDTGLFDFLRGLRAVVSDVEDGVAYMSVPRLGVFEGRAHPELIMVAHDLVPRDLRAQAGGLKRLLVIDAGSAQVCPRTGSYDL